MRQLVFLCSAVVLLGAGGSRVLADAKNPTYDDDVLPIVKQACVNCHGNDKQKGGLNLATFAALQQGGSSGVAVTPGDPGKSRLYTLTTHAEEPKMPPKGNKIPDGQLALLKTWIEQGARENSGSKMAVAGCGFLLNNTIADFRIASGPNWYGLLQGDRNRLDSDRRPASSMTPALVMKDGHPVADVTLVKGSEWKTVSEKLD